MTSPNIDWNALEATIQEIIDLQQKRLLSCGRQIVPNLTADDMLQPNDFLELEHHPVFRYEEGVLAGVQTVQMAICALKSDSFFD